MTHLSKDAQVWTLNIEKTNMNALIRTVIVSSVVTATAGCSTVRNIADAEGSEQLSGVDKHSSYPAIRRPYFEQVNILELVDPTHERDHLSDPKRGRMRSDDEQSGTSAGTERRTLNFGVEYDLALAAFRTKSKDDPEGARLHRNSVQERILAVSTSRCNVFKTYLRRQQSENNFLLGSLTTAAGVLGAVLPGVNSSRNLAGAAGLFSGVQAEYNQAFFSNLASQVIVKGIDAKQAATYDRIRKVGQPMSVADYPMEAAIKDAIYYDGLCSTIVGLNEAGESIALAKNPGLEAASRTVLRSRVLQKIATEDLQTLTADESLQKLGVSLEDVYASPVAVPIPQSPDSVGVGPDQLFRSLDSLKSGLSRSVQREAIVLGEAFLKREAKLLAPASATQSQEQRAQAFRTLLQGKLVDVLDFAKLGKATSAAATKVSTARNEQRAATAAADKATTKQALVKAELDGEVMRRCFLMLQDLTDLDIRKASTEIAADIESANNTSALTAVLSKAVAPDKSKNATCP